ncbi:hypothetical protein G7054_g5412 [Neopestalotiopsis clavispora]|nr:hypothetical protein G7054_g5412 [Neopestalotiopsis clavispora]
MSNQSSRSRHVRVQEPERRPLLERARFAHSLDGGDFFSCMPNSHAHLPVYTNIHRIRRDVISIVEDYLTFEQLRDLRLNISVVRPLVDKLQNVNFTRAMLCEVVATRILRRFGEDNEGDQGLLVLAHILVAGFTPFQNAPDGVRNEESLATKWDFHRTLPALEVAIISESKYFLSSTHCQKVIDAIYTGHIVYTPSTFLDLIPDRYKQKPISLYEPREAPLLNQYRLIVPRTRNLLEIMQFIILLCLYLAFMAERDAEQYSFLEMAFSVYAFGWVLDQFATILEHGWNVYTQNLWSFLDVMFAMVYWAYLILRLHGWVNNDIGPGQQALDVLAIGAPVLVPRLAFNLLSDNLVFLSLRSMMADFTLLTMLAAWCFGGFLLSMVWLAEGRHDFLTISKWMLWIWFGLDGTGVSQSNDFHWLLGPILMITFAFLGNTLFLTILVSMLSNTFSTIVANATSEIQFRRAVQTLEGVKADAIFAYQPPFNILAVFVLLPMKFVVSPRWFHKIHVASVRFINLPVLLLIAAAERRLFHPATSEPTPARKKTWFWEDWRITTHGDLQTVFEIEPPQELTEDIAVDDDLTRHMIRRQFVRQHSTTAQEAIKRGRSDAAEDGDKNRVGRPPARRDSIAPYGSDLTEQVRHILADIDAGKDIGVSNRLEALEDSVGRIEKMLSKFCGAGSDVDEKSLDEEEDEAALGPPSDLNTAEILED